jgi:hypothetical protein
MVFEIEDMDGWETMSEEESVCYELDPRKRKDLNVCTPTGTVSSTPKLRLFGDN